MAKKKENKSKKGNMSKKKNKKEKIDLDWEKLYLSIKELGERQKETDRIVKEVAERQKETEKMIEKTHQEIQELAKRQEEDRKQLAEFGKHVDDFRKEVDNFRKHVDNFRKEIDNFRKQVARITDSWGRFVEGMVEPAAISYFRNKGFVPYEVYQRLKVSRNGKNAEYDLLLEAPEHKTAMLVSAKTHVSSRDVNELEEDIKSLSFFLPRLRGYRVIGAIAGISFGKGADKFAFRKGFVILKVSEDTFQIIEPKKLKVFKL